MSEHFRPDIGSRRALWEARSRFFTTLDELCPRARQDLLRIWSAFEPAYREVERDRSAHRTGRASPPSKESWLRPQPESFADWYDERLQANDSSALELQQKIET